MIFHKFMMRRPLNVRLVSNNWENYVNNLPAISRAESISKEN